MRKSILLPGGFALLLIHSPGRAAIRPSGLDSYCNILHLCLNPELLEEQKLVVFISFFISAPSMYARNRHATRFATKMSDIMGWEQPHWEISLLSSQLYDKDFHINRSQNALFTWAANVNTRHNDSSDFLGESIVRRVFWREASCVGAGGNVLRAGSL